MLSPPQSAALEVIRAFGPIRTGDVAEEVRYHVGPRDYRTGNRLTLRTLVSLKKRGLVIECEPNVWRVADGRDAP